MEPPARYFGGPVASAVFKSRMLTKRPMPHKLEKVIHNYAEIYG